MIKIQCLIYDIIININILPQTCARQSWDRIWPGILMDQTHRRYFCSKLQWALGLQ